MKRRLMMAGVVMWGCAAMAQDPPWSEPLDWLEPSVHLNAAVGVSSAPHPEELALGHHDPTREEGTLQGLELGLSLRTPYHLEGFATYAIFYGADEEWDGQWEEAFLKLAELPGGFSLRGGRLLTRFGLRNATHLHGWNTVDMPLVLGRFLGDDGMAVDGGDVTWTGSRSWWHYGLVAGYGKLRKHDHDHGHEDEAHDHHEEHDSPVHVEAWDDEAFFGRAFALFQGNDFASWQLGSSLAAGDNEWGKTSLVWGVDLRYQWRERGFAAGGRAWEWNLEILRRELHVAVQHQEDTHHDAHGADHAHHDPAADFTGVSEWGAYTEALFTWNECWTSGVRLGTVEGIAEAGLEKRYRVSPVLTWRPRGSEQVSLRLQYNVDHLEEGEEHGVWAQLGLSWGGSEIR